MLGSLLLAVTMLGFQAPKDVPPDAAKLAAIEARQPDDKDEFNAPSDKRHAQDLKNDNEEGKKFALEVEKQEKLSKDKAMQDRVERVGQQIARIANHNNVVSLWGDKRLNPYHYHYKVLVGDDVNAFSLPGGYVYVYEGLIKFIESDDELAGILAHETAHASLRHIATLSRESNKSLLIQIPILIAAILTHNMAVAQTGQIYGQAQQSGWSVKAEKAANYAGFQYMVKGPYNPVAMLTFMERLAQKERYLDPILRNLGILQTHPVTPERADAMMADLKAFNIPVERSKASPSYRVTLKDGRDGAVEAFFGGRKIFVFAGIDARERAEQALPQLNAFYDTVPQMFDVSSQGDRVVWKGKTLLVVHPEDAKLANASEDQLTANTVEAIKQTLFTLSYKIPDTRVDRRG